jgi:hypothetical protein
MLNDRIGNIQMTLNFTSKTQFFLAYLCTMNAEQHKDIKGRAEALRRYL